MPRRPWLRLGVAVGLSALVHACVLGVVATVVWRIAATPQPSGPDKPADVFLLSIEPPKAVPVAATKEAIPEPPPPPTPTPAPPPPPVETRVAETERVVPARASPAPVPTRAAPSRPAAASIPARAVASQADQAERAPPIGVAFAGLSAQRAASVVYVVDASGPMVTTLPLVLAEVRRSVAALAGEQKFGVVLFSERADGAGGTGGSASGAQGPGVRALASVLSPATVRNQAQLREWLKSARAGGRSNPLEGLRAAMAMQPQVVFLLSRAIARTGGGRWDQGVAKTLEELDALNPIDPATGRRRVVVKTIQFLEDDPTGLMQAIAAAHGSGGGAGAWQAGPNGRAPAVEDYRVLSAEELGR